MFRKLLISRETSLGNRAMQQLEERLSNVNKDVRSFRIPITGACLLIMKMTASRKIRGKNYPLTEGTTVLLGIGINKRRIKIRPGTVMSLREIPMCLILKRRD